MVTKNVQYCLAFVPSLTHNVCNDHIKFVYYAVKYFETVLMILGFCFY